MASSSTLACTILSTSLAVKPVPLTLFLFKVKALVLDVVRMLSLYHDVCTQQ